MGGVRLRTVHVRAVEDEGTVGSQCCCLAEAELLRMLAKLAVRRLEVDEVARREVHVLHVLICGGLRVVQQLWGRNLKVVLAHLRNVALEHELRMRDARCACVWPLKALILSPRLGLASRYRARLRALRIDKRQLLLVGERISQDLLASQLRRDQLNRTGTLWLAGATLGEVLQSAAWLLSQWILVLVHRVETILGHLHQLPLV